MIPESIRHDTLSAREREYFMLYNNLLTEYNDSAGLDLTADLEVVFHDCTTTLCDCPLLTFLCLPPTVNVALAA